ncbi:S41 family peptidase [Flavitalea sp. BT771]|uniref:S41 family peptidase n=1 Tax=Flavitalea sp. BT771 TaxID=3063329 RepID=UPI0026E235AF|nr:S41 family peptidase [Flavitalea sp. BT771]MDO6434331.1 S41 family peptidase [Flavitalea sp. BT771]MDV6223231.1 S41 family peptidase [Flavitalea sp. BT771]
MKQAFLILWALLFLSQWSPAQMTNQQQKNLTAFTRLYGYARYFHPSDEGAELDWDKFAIYGSSIVMSAKDDKALISTLKELFHPFAPTIAIYAAGQGDPFSSASITPPDTNNYKPIAWQHLGVALSSNSVYKSIRVNRPSPEIAAVQGFAPVSQTFSADRIKGKEFRLSGWMKVDSTWGGAGHLWMRIAKKGQVVYFYNMDNRPATSGTWKEYSFTGQADMNADTLFMGAFLSGKGSLLIDHIRLSVKEAGEWKEVPLENGSFENDNPTAKGWRYNQNLAGYRFATESKDAQDGAKAFSIVSVKGASLQNRPVAQPLFDHYPRPGESIHTSLVSGIDCNVPLALYGNKEHSWPTADTAALTRLQKAIQAAAPASVSGDALSVRLGDIVIAWNIFRHFFAYWDDASAAPEQLLDKALWKAAMDKTQFDFVQTLKLMTAPLNDGHIYISFQRDTVQRAYAPLTFVQAESKLLIEQVLDSNLRTSISPGDVVTTYNGQPAAAYLKDLDQTVSGSPQLRAFRIAAELPIGRQDSSLTLTIQRPDGIHTVNVRTSNNWQTWYGAQANRPSGWLRPGIFYIDIEKAPMDSINAWMPQLTQAKAIICDLRGYPNSNHELINHLLDTAEDTKWMFIPEITYPDYQHVSYKGGGWQMTPQSPHLGGKIFFLTDGSAISYAESYMGFIKDFHLATIVGQPTAGTNGNINPFTLPGGYRISWTGMLVKDHNGGKHHLKGITPDVPVQRTIQGIREGRDEFLEKAIGLAEKF